MRTTTAIKLTDEGHDVLAVTIDSPGGKGLKVQVSPNNGHGTWGCFASCSGTGHSHFSGKAYKTKDAAIRAAAKWLEKRAAQMVEDEESYRRGLEVIAASPEAPTPWVKDVLDAFERGEDMVVIRDDF